MLPLALVLFFSSVGLLFDDQLIILLGGTNNIMPYAKTYLRVYSFVFPFLFLDILSQYFFVTEGKAFMGMIVVILSGVLSIILNYWLIAVLKVGILGAAVAMGLVYVVPSLVYLVYFSKKKNKTLYFVKAKLHKGFIFNTCVNGSSEMVSHLALAIVSTIMNIIMGKLAGNNGIAAVSVIIQVQFLLSSIYIGFGAGVAPIFAFAQGENNRQQTKKVFRISIMLIGVSSIGLVLLCIIFGDSIVSAFINPTSPSFKLAKMGFGIFSMGYFLAGLNIFASVFFTSVSNGKISALISFLRTFVFILGMLILLPPILNTTGVWLAIPIAELLAVIVSIILFKKHKHIYHY